MPSFEAIKKKITKKENRYNLMVQAVARTRQELKTLGLWGFDSDELLNGLKGKFDVKIPCTERQAIKGAMDYVIAAHAVKDISESHSSGVSEILQDFIGYGDAPVKEADDCYFFTLKESNDKYHKMKGKVIFGYEFGREISKHRTKFMRIRVFAY